MSRRFYFTNENGDNIGNDHIGNIRGAKTVAKRLANELNCEVCINDCETEDMIDFVYPDKETKTETETEAVETVEQTEIETEETAENKYIAEEYRNYFITGNERIGIVALDTHGHYCDKVFKTLEEAKRAVDEDIEYAEKKYAEQEAEAETTAVETAEQVETETTVEQETEAEEKTMNFENIGGITRSTPENRSKKKLMKEYHGFHDDCKKRYAVKYRKGLKNKPYICKTIEDYKARHTTA